MKSIFFLIYRWLSFQIHEMKIFFSAMLLATHLYTLSKCRSNSELSLMASLASTTVRSRSSHAICLLEKMTAIKHALQRDIFTPNDERLLSIVNVCKAGKKKRNCFLCATVTTERPVQVKVIKVKKSDKGDFYKRQIAWELRDLTVVDAKDAIK
ncbi:PREDICTED: exocyst complex component 1-like, partial [Thamnophis sirtalis]|uniref:Exocyst complex component 1-like n=1 Tax=Thamnophis sirtalis TaxID=35019 RepID=A0A6I9YTL3_9SAUR